MRPGGGWSAPEIETQFISFNFTNALICADRSSARVASNSYLHRAS